MSHVAPRPAKRGEGGRRPGEGRYALAVLCFLLSSTLSAADFEVGARYLTVRPNDALLRNAMGFGVDAEVFFSNRVSANLAASFVQPVAIYEPADVDLGTLGITPITLTGRYYFMDKRLTPFVGAGPAWFMLGDLDDFFDDKVLADFDARLVIATEAGLRYRMRSPLSFAMVVCYIPLDADLNIRRSDNPSVTLPARLEIDPLFVAVGASWRF